MSQLQNVHNLPIWINSKDQSGPQQQLLCLLSGLWGGGNLHSSAVFLGLALPVCAKHSNANSLGLHPWLKCMGCIQTRPVNTWTQKVRKPEGKKTLREFYGQSFGLDLFFLSNGKSRVTQLWWNKGPASVWGDFYAVHHNHRWKTVQKGGWWKSFYCMLKCFSHVSLFLAELVKVWFEHLIYRNYGISTWHFWSDVEKV